MDGVKDKPEFTLHGTERMWQRVGLNQAAANRLASKALSEGIGRDQATGIVRKYIDRLWARHKKGDNARIYGEHAYIFHGNVLITVLHLPHDVRRAANKLRQKMK